MTVSLSTRATSLVRPRRSRTARRVPIVGILPLLIALALWQLSGGSRPYLPPPSTWIEGLADLWNEGKLGPAILETLTSAGIAMFFSILIGSVLGALIGRVRLLDRALDPLLEFIRFTPSAAMVPVAVLLLGYEQGMKVTVVVLGAIWPILLNIRLGTKSIDSSVTELGRSLHMGPLDTLRKIVIPMVVPYLIIGTRIATPSILILTLLVEIVTYVPGLGSLFAAAQVTFQTNQIYGLVLISGVLGVAVNALIVWISGYLLRYRPEG